MKGKDHYLFCFHRVGSPFAQILALTPSQRVWDWRAEVTPAESPGCPHLLHPGEVSSGCNGVRHHGHQDINGCSMFLPQDPIQLVLATKCSHLLGTDSGIRSWYVRIFHRVDEMA